MRVLLSWLGTDEMARAKGAVANAPLTDALKAGPPCDQVLLLNNRSKAEAAHYVAWLGSQLQIEVETVTLTSPVDYGAIHIAAVAAIESLRKKDKAVELMFFLNSGTPPMGSVWLLLGKSRYQSAKLVAWSAHSKRLETVEVPFEISAEYVPALLEKADATWREASLERVPARAAFSSIVHRCSAMADVVERARRVALHNVPVLIEGESGTGKEIFAKAIHNGSPRSSKPFIAVNCGAIPENLAEAELFGHSKGAFTGATEARLGHFREAEGGTLFLDEIGELPLAAQVKLLRPLQEGQVLPVGASRPIPVNVRVIAATHRSLVEDVGNGWFREDLFYRLAVAVLKLPPLREREGDLTALVDHLLEEINRQNQGAVEARSLTPAARNVLAQHQWPGNIRELANTLRRAVVWSRTSSLGAADVQGALLPTAPRSGENDILQRPLGEGFDINHLKAELEAHYIKRALQISEGKRAEAARLLGLKSHQVLANRIDRSISRQHRGPEPSAFSRRDVLPRAVNKAK